MKFQKKVQFFFLILALVIFAGQELVHPVFHKHQKASLIYFHCQDGRTEDIKKAGKFTNDASLEIICPVCSAVTHKSTQASRIQTELIRGKVPDYSQSCESFSFSPYIKPVSRGPPSV